MTSIFFALPLQSITEIAFIRPSCLPPIFTVGTLKDGASKFHLMNFQLQLCIFHETEINLRTEGQRNKNFYFFIKNFD